VKADETPDGTLLVTYHGTGMTKIMVVLMTLLVGTAAYDVWLGARGTDRLVALLASAATCALAAVAALETARFEFNRATRIVTWRRRWGFRERSGTIPCDSIQAVVTERPPADSGTPNRRLTLMTTGDGAVPLTIGYRPDSDKSIESVAGRIRTWLGHDAGDAHDRHVALLLAAGKIVEAIRVLRQEEGLSLVDARRRVDELRNRPSDIRQPSP
jgi:hypothetical protein